MRRKPTRWLLIGLLMLASAGCARRDWVSDLLVLTDVTDLGRIGEGGR